MNIVSYPAHLAGRIAGTLLSPIDKELSQKPWKALSLAIAGCASGFFCHALVSDFNSPQSQKPLLSLGTAMLLYHSVTFPFFVTNNLYEGISTRLQDYSINTYNRTGYPRDLERYVSLNNYSPEMKGLALLEATKKSDVGPIHTLLKSPMGSQKSVALSIALWPTYSKFTPLEAALLLTASLGTEVYAKALLPYLNDKKIAQDCKRAIYAIAKQNNINPIVKAFRPQEQEKTYDSLYSKEIARARNAKAQAARALLGTTRRPVSRPHRPILSHYT